jgi:hypothetical protein
MRLFLMPTGTILLRPPIANWAHGPQISIAAKDNAVPLIPGVRGSDLRGPPLHPASHRRPSGGQTRVSCPATRNPRRLDLVAPSLPAPEKRFLPDRRLLLPPQTGRYYPIAQRRPQSPVELHRTFRDHSGRGLIRYRFGIEISLHSLRSLTALVNLVSRSGSGCPLLLLPLRSNPC